jgi:hypothetical protein
MSDQKSFSFYYQNWIIAPYRESPKVVILEEPEATKDLEFSNKIMGEILQGVYPDPKTEILRYRSG